MGNFNDLFKFDKPIIGMLHFAGKDSGEKIGRALEEFAIYDSCGVDGAIIENYSQGSRFIQMAFAVDAIQDPSAYFRKRKNYTSETALGMNLLGNPNLALAYAGVNNDNVRFVQYDSIDLKDRDLELYKSLRKEYPSVVVLGGVGFKYIPPSGRPLEEDIENARTLCDAIVTTGSGTGIETPLAKLERYKGLMGDFPLIVGAGVNSDNIRDQLQIADGAIVGSYFKPYGDTERYVEREKVQDLMSKVRDIRRK